MLNQFVMDTVSNAGALAVVDMVEPLVPNSTAPALQYAKRGLLWSVADEALDQWWTGTSLIGQGDWIGLGDKIVYNGAVNYAVDASGIAENLYSQFGSLNPFGERVGVLLLSGAIKTTTDGIGRMIDRAYPDSALSYLTHAVSNGKKNVGW